jgi:hypothetical protein
MLDSPIRSQSSWIPFNPIPVTWTVRSEVPSHLDRPIRGSFLIPQELETGIGNHNQESRIETKRVNPN